MKRWNSEKREQVRNRAIDAFLLEVVHVGQRHGFALSHEDRYGAFMVKRFNDADAAWLLKAHDATGEPV